MNRRINFSLLMIVVLMLSANAFAWGDTGHMAVAQIAYNNLSPAKKERVDELAALIRLNNRGYEFVTAACWMDDIRDEPAFEPLKDFHFITQMNIVGNAAVLEEPPPVNAVEVIRFLTRKLASNRESDPKKAYYLAELLHLVGDIHQPLHTATRYTPERPGGDLGGNLFSLPESAPSDNLHAYWDAGGGLFDFRTVQRPLTTASRTSLKNYVARITTDNKKSAMTNAVAMRDPQVWALEGFGLTLSDVYPNIDENEMPSQNYQRNAKRVSARRIALAGYRLAALLERAL